MAKNYAAAGTPYVVSAFTEVCKKEKWMLVPHHLILPNQWLEDWTSTCQQAATAWVDMHGQGSRPVDIYIIVDLVPTLDARQVVSSVMRLSTLLTKATLVTIRLVGCKPDTNSKTLDYFNQLNRAIGNSWSNMGLHPYGSFISPCLSQKEADQTEDPRTSRGFLTKLAVRKHIYLVLQQQRANTREVGLPPVLQQHHAEFMEVSLPPAMPPPNKRKRGAASHRSPRRGGKSVHLTSHEGPKADLVDHPVHKKLGGTPIQHEPQDAQVAQLRRDLALERATVHRLLYVAGQSTPNREYIKSIIKEELPSLLASADRLQLPESTPMTITETQIPHQVSQRKASNIVDAVVNESCSAFNPAHSSLPQANFATTATTPSDQPIVTFASFPSATTTSPKTPTTLTSIPECDNFNTDLLATIMPDENEVTFDIGNTDGACSGLTEDYSDDRLAELMLMQGSPSTITTIDADGDGLEQKLM